MITKNILTPEYNIYGNFLRQIRSFVCRNGRITRSQLRAIKNYWSLFGIDFQFNEINFSSIFFRSAPLILEIGFGSGQSLVQSAIDCPEKNFLGIEVYKSGIGSCLKYAFVSQIKNLKIIYHDAVEVINYMIPNNTLFMVNVFFPDPWNKNRHKKRRLLKYEFLYVLLKKLVYNGILHVVTDSLSYTHDILLNIDRINKINNNSYKKYLFKVPLSYPVTKFEKKSRVLGNKIFNLVFQSR